MPTLMKRCSQCQNWQPCPDHQRAYDRTRPSAVKRGYRSDPNSTWQRVRRIVLSQNPICVDTTEGRCTRPSVHVDHVISKSKGGPDRPSN